MGIAFSFSMLFMKVSSCGMSDAIGPVHIKERPSTELQSRIDAEVCYWQLCPGQANSFQTLKFVILCAGG